MGEGVIRLRDMMDKPIVFYAWISGHGHGYGIWAVVAATARAVSVMIAMAAMKAMVCRLSGGVVRCGYSTGRAGGNGAAVSVLAVAFWRAMRRCRAVCPASGASATAPAASDAAAEATSSASVADHDIA